MEGQFEISIKWNGKDITVSNLELFNTIADLKNELYMLTKVNPNKQKLLGLKLNDGTSAITNETRLEDLKYKPGTKIMMMGTVDEVINEMNKIPENLPEVVDDFVDKNLEEVQLQNREENLAKVNRRIKEYKITIVNEPRPGKKLLVLDIDYTLFDHVSPAQSGSELMRPYLHEFLTLAYEDYDIMIWSATSMKWIDAKLQEMGITRNPNYKLVCCLDGAAMISVYTAEYGLLNVKPLQVIWGKFPDHYSPKNTIMFDDLKRNFLMNPQNGLRIEPYKNAHTNRTKDNELYRLSIYLKKISQLEDLSELKHRHWPKYI